MTRILIADDNPQNLYLLESILKARQFEVVSARNGAEALDTARKNLPGLIIADILMPVMDGFELLRRWKADEHLKKIPFIFYTATYTDPRDEKFALGLGADRFILKPQKPDVLHQMVTDILEETKKKELISPTKALEDEMELLRQHNEVLYRKLEKKVRDLEDEIAKHRMAEERAHLANRKLALMTDITYQDIQNKVIALRGYIDLSQKNTPGEDPSFYIGKEREILEMINSVIQKSKEYQQMGIGQSRWIPLEPLIRLQMSLQSRKHSIELHCDLEGLEIYSDPLIDRVFFNLIQNSIRHGGKTSRVSFTCRKDPAGLLILCEDDGTGIPLGEKPYIFERISGGEGKFGLFFAREFLALSGMTISETGTAGRGARFEILVQNGAYRFSRVQKNGIDS